MKIIITDKCEPTINPNPIWRLKSHVVTTIYEFDVVSPTTGEILNTTRLHHRYNSDKSYDMYHGCDYRFSGYNPTPVTDWFRGVPLKQMLEWCESHNLRNCRCIKKFIDNKCVDRSVSTTSLNF